ncbi:S41 family peptidase [Fodinibius salsisoli]|uniref:Tricorn protease homolog n=1 Tax=Fodinibius salsisoli TaxID=2820877 RepID=A0ABT3PNU6_9BACT|nr:S41 family peptidase [Fodinibius salsisoli]MCW9707520.1 PD40 domain-containing protein [Fodinibius salsisoli]
MKKLLFLIVLVLFIPFSTLYAQTDQPFARFPSVSPDGSKIAFSYQGDIWTVPQNGGQAIRLTIHEAYESRPRWSPDGQKIAFISDRHGNDDLFVMDASGRNIKRLTYHSTSDELTGWTHDSQQLLFTTNRLYNQVEWEPEIHTVAAEGGTPNRFFDAFGLMASMSPDGRFIVFVRGYNKEYRKDYRGPANKDLWVFDTEDNSYRQLTDFKGNDMYPAFADDNDLYFISERTGTHNLYKTTLTDRGTFSTTPQKLTNLEGDGIRYFSVSDDGETIIVEHNTGLYSLEDNSLSSLALDVATDNRHYNIERKSFSDDAEEFAISPSGDYLAFVIKGDIFIKHNDPEKKRAVKVTDHPYRDRDVAFLDDSTLIFASDRNGQYDLYSLRPADDGETKLYESLRFTTARLTNTDQDERDPVVSPNGEKVAFNRGRGQLILANITGRTSLSGESILLETGWAEAEDVAWSPDNKWLAYALPDLNFNTEIYIHPIDNSQEPVNISKHPRPDTDPVWSPDGSKLAFLSSRNNGDDDVWFAWLNKRDWQRTNLDWEKSQQPRKVNAKDTSTVNVRIDFEDLYKRLHQVTSLPGNESDIAISKDGETFYFVTNRDSRQNYDADQDIYRSTWDGENLTALTDGNVIPWGLRLNHKLNALYFMHRGGTIKRYKDKKVTSLPFSARTTINHQQQRQQIFEEAWRTIDNGFYDPDFHGQNWQQIHDHYKPWIEKVSSDRDFEDVMNMMLGELNASHMGFYGSERAETQDIRTGLIGAEVEPVTNGVEVQSIVPNSPADREVSQLHVGDIITHVDDKSVAQTDNFYSLLADKVNTPTLLTVQDPQGQNRDVVMEPTSSLSLERYNQWVEKRKELTEQYSNGRLGYIHVEGMNWPSFERFERELVATGEGKDGIVIDVRYNGGGWTTDYLLTVLNYRQHAYTIPRGATSNLKMNKSNFRDHYPFGERLPLSSWTRPSITLANQNSYSNAEIFSHAFKQLNLGTLVGEPTFGAVISTGGAGLMGDSYIRLPYRGWYVKATNKNMEHGPAVPDIEVINPPDYRNGEDQQLKRAVDVLLQQIDNE